MLNPLAIAVQGIGFGAAQAAAQGLLGVYEEPPVAPPAAPGGGGSTRIRKQPVRSEYPGLRAQLLAEDEIVLAVITAAVTRGILH